MPKRSKSFSEDGPESALTKRIRRFNPSQACIEVINALKSYRSEDDRVLFDHINQLYNSISSASPSQQTDEQSQQPSSSEEKVPVISSTTFGLNFEQIANKTMSEQYENLEEFYSDVEAVLDCVKNRFVPEQQEHNDANELLEFYTDVKQDIYLKDEIVVEENVDEEKEDEEKDDEEKDDEEKDDEEKEIENGDGEDEREEIERPGSANESTTTADIETHLEELFSTVMTATEEGEDRQLSAMFRLLPSKKDYANYYKVISEPIDLKTIGQKIQNNEYTSLNELEKDLLLMVKNAKLYNEPGSKIYRDANALRKIISTKKAEIDQKKFFPIKTSERIKAKKCSHQKWSSVAAAFAASDISPNASSVNLNDESNFDDNEMDQDDVDSIEYQLYSFVRNYKSQGATLSDPFMRLPNRRFYPDYYDEIKRPISLGKINGKIRLGQYDTVTELADELNLVFKNAMRYNRSDSKIYKDAAKLQKAMLQKAKELIGYEPREEDSFTEEDEEPEEEIEMKEEEETTQTPQPKKRGRKPKDPNFQQSTPAPDSGPKKSRKSTMELDPAVKRRMRQLYKTLFDYQDNSGRYLISLFMEKPSKRDYADYYEVIKSPIDMKTIDSNIKNELYPNEDALLRDFKLMFDNCRQYNEEDSEIYRDANKLESILHEKAKELDLASVFKLKKGKLKSSGELLHKLKSLFESVIQYKHSDNRQLSKVFMKLPSRVDYPQYYDVIKRPLDLDKIGNRLKHGHYESLEDLLSDLVLSFDNACKFNEPDSQIYKDALCLQHFALQKKLELVEASVDGIPDVRSLVQDLLVNLFTSVYNRQDDDGRCYIDSLLETIEQNRRNSVSGEEQMQNQLAQTKPLSFLQIKTNLKKGRYRRLDRFQADVFSIFERVRHISRTDSQAFEDSIEMQQYFIRLRNELCKNGERLLSPALNFTEADLDASVENLRKEKLPFEQQEFDQDSKMDVSFVGGDLISSCIEGQPQPEVTNDECQELTVNDITYRVGDFVYVEPKEKNLEAHIINIQSITKDLKGEPSIYGCWFYRPNETFHIASRRFLEREVFKSDKFNSTPFTQVIGKCIVMFVKDYFKYKPIGFEDQHVYVCESRYSTKNKLFKKIKAWSYPLHYEQSFRNQELPMVRVPSVFKMKQEKGDDELEDNQYTLDTSVLNDSEDTLLDVLRLDVRCDGPEGFVWDPSVIHYEQIVAHHTSFKLGDFCFVRSGQENVIFRIDRIWREGNNPAQFEGLRFLKKGDVPLSGYGYYPQEVFLGYQVERHFIEEISGRCCVLNYKDFTTRRPTEIVEDNVFICENKYNFDSKTLTKLTTALQTSPKNPNIIDDEYYLFHKPLSLKRNDPEPEKVNFIPTIVKKVPHLNFEMVPSSPMSVSTILPSSETENEESNDVMINSFISTEVSNQQAPVTTPQSKKYKTQKRMVTGYILFASEIRKSVVQSNPASNFGEISRIIGNEWKSLTTESKAEYERRAQKQNEVAMKEAAKLAEAESLPNSAALQANLLLECNWEQCDFQFEDALDLSDHLINDTTGHVYKSYGHLKDKEGQPVFQCLVKGCPRVKKGGVPFPSISRLIRHCKDIHVGKQSPKFALPENRSKNYTPSKNGINHSIQFGSQHSNPGLIIQQPGQPFIVNGIPHASHLIHPGYSDQFFQGASNMMVNSINYHVPGSNGGLSPNNLAGQLPNAPPPKPSEMLFVAPVKPNRLLYTDTYIRYIERLKPDCRHITNWEAQLNATPESTPIQDRIKLPTHWLANKEGNHGSVVNALWALRNFMFQDTLKCSQNSK